MYLKSAPANCAVGLAGVEVDCCSGGGNSDCCQVGLSGSKVQARCVVASQVAVVPLV